MSADLPRGVVSLATQIPVNEEATKATKSIWFSYEKLAKHLRVVYGLDRSFAKKMWVHSCAVVPDNQKIFDIDTGTILRIKIKME